MEEEMPSQEENVVERAISATNRTVIFIERTAFGPDISKYKFTGQEEDKESGLMYYKARYYDSRIGRFLQQDSMVFPNQINGMNRMMYVEGNPVGFRDVSGNNISQSLMGAIAGYIMAPEDKKLEGAILGYQYGRNIDKKRNKLTVQKALFKTERFIKNNLLSGDKISRWYNRAFNNEKYKNTKEHAISNFIQLYSRRNECKNTFGSSICGLLDQLAFIWDERSEKDYAQSRSINFNLTIKPSNEREDGRNNFIIFFGWNTLRNADICARGNSEDPKSNEDNCQKSK
jgi:RHS repeat-associated protein